MVCKSRHAKELQLLYSELQQQPWQQPQKQWQAASLLSQTKERNIYLKNWLGENSGLNLKTSHLDEEIYVAGED